MNFLRTEFLTRLWGGKFNRLGGCNTQFIGSYEAGLDAIANMWWPFLNF